MPNEDQVQGTAQSLLRVDVVTTESGELAIAGVVQTERIAPTSVVPVAPSGEAIVVAYAGQRALGLDVVRLPQFALGIDRDGHHTKDAIPLTRPSFTALVPSTAEATHVRLMLPDGSVLDERQLADLPKQKDGGGDYVYRPFKRHPHIRILLTGQDDQLVPQTVTAAVGALSLPTKDSLALVEQALDEMGPAASAAIRNIGFSDCPKDAWASGMTFGSNIVVQRTDCPGSANPEVFRKYVVHEATHAFNHLVDAALGVGDLPRHDLAEWDGPWSEIAAEQIAALHLSDALTPTWADLHSTAVEMGLSVSYSGNPRVVALSEAQATENGFATPYGSTTPVEDIAELSTEIQLGHGAHPLCAAFQAATPDNFPLPLAVPLAKIEFLSALGLVTEDNRRACLHDFALAGPPGIHLRSGEGMVSFPDEVLGGRYTNDQGTRLLTVMARSGPVSAMLELETGPGTGLGIHRLDQHDDFLLAKLGNNSFLWANSEDSDRSRLSKTGLVLVTEVSEQQVTGLMFLVAMRSAIFVTDRFAVGTFRVDRPKLAN